MVHKLDSSIQMKSEEIILEKLEQQLGLTKDSLKTKRMQLNDKV